MEMEMKIHRIRIDNDGQRNEKNFTQKNIINKQQSVHGIELRWVRPCASVSDEPNNRGFVQWHLALETFTTHYGRRMAIAPTVWTTIKVNTERMYNKKWRCLRVFWTHSCVSIENILSIAFASIDSNISIVYWLLSLYLVEMLFQLLKMFAQMRRANEEGQQNVQK